MKKLFFFIFASVCFSAASFAGGGAEDIGLSSPFRLNPILGIRGDDYEASSKFVQRLIFSPLVFPLEDPYLQDNYSVAPDLSIIETLEYENADGTWNHVPLEKPGTDSSRHFRVRLRENLNFNQAGAKRPYDALTSEDVVYSYRLARITMDRAFQSYLNSSAKKRAAIGMNTLLYSKIKTLRSVYLDASDLRYVYFMLDSNKTARDFLMFLSYVPVLSAKQINAEGIKRNSASKEYKSLHSRLDFSELYNSKTLSSREYDLYDFTVQEKSALGREFYEQPIGYGQLLVKSTHRYGGGSRDMGIYDRCDFTRNKDWCVFPPDNKNLNGYTFTHSNFSSDNADIRIEYLKDSREPVQKVNNRELAVAYNVPLAASDFPNDTELQQLSKIVGKRKMQISHQLFGIFFGPSADDKSKPMYKGVRDFFACFADRPRLENILKFMTGETDWSTFDANIKAADTIISDLQMQRLYYPFYTGGSNSQNRASSEIGRYYNNLENADSFTQEYLSELGSKTLKPYYTSISNSARRNEFYQKFVGGTDYAEIESELLSRFNQVKSYIVFNNEVKIDIVYFKDDKIGMTIAVHYAEVFKDFFRANGISRVDINSVELDGGANEWKRKAEANSSAHKLSLLVKGWNYKFDMLDELQNQWIDDGTYNTIERQYREFIDGKSQINAESMYYLVARQFVDNTVMIPLVGVQNYAVYRTGSETAVSAEHPAPAFTQYENIEILLLPYYWKGRY